jgi:hypothetical protein
MGMERAPKQNDLRFKVTVISFADPAPLQFLGEQKSLPGPCALPTQNVVTKGFFGSNAVSPNLTSSTSEFTVAKR